MTASKSVAQRQSLAVAEQRDSERDVASCLPASEGVAELPSDAVLLELLDTAECGILLFGTKGNLWSAAGRISKIIGVDPARLRGLPDFESVVAALSPHFADSKAVAARWRERRKTGELCWDELKIAQPQPRIAERFGRPVRDRRGRQIAWLEIYRDVTRLRLSESRMFHTERVAALGQLASGIAHELSNPLTGILGYAQLLLRRAGSHGGEEAQRILEEAERASRIAKNLLLFAREARPERTLVDLNDIIERTMALRAYQLRQENISANLDLDPRLPRTLGDPIQLQQVVLNLVVNAEQSIQQAGSEGRIWLRTWCDSANRIALQVTDDGPGIPPDVAPRIFDPFFTTKPPGVGTGLGLSVLYSIVQQHGGSVAVGACPAGGASFTVRLPATGKASPASHRDSGRNAVPRASPPLPVVLRPDAPSTSVSAQRILVVEDEPTVAHLIADVLSEEGHTVDRVLDSREALELARRRTYSLVICDLRMPHLDGRGFYRELLRQGHPLQYRLVFVTGDTLAPRTVEFLERSGVPYLAKPFLVEELKEIVVKALADAESDRKSGKTTARRITRPLRNS